MDRGVTDVLVTGGTRTGIVGTREGLGGPWHGLAGHGNVYQAQLGHKL